MADCQDNIISVSSNPCVIYTGPSIAQVGLISGQCYLLSEIISKLWQYIAYISGGGTTTTSTTSTSTSTSSTTTTTTTVSFNTSLTFASSTSDSEQGVQGQALATNPLLKVEFNFISPVIGLYSVMNILVQNVPVLQLTFRSEYTSQPFRFTHTNGTQYNGVFGPDINF